MEEISMMTRDIIRVPWRQVRIACTLLSVIGVICSTHLLPWITSAVIAEDQCGEQGITVRNATMLDLWYTKNGGACSIWIHEHLFTIKQREIVKIFSDMSCQTFYCTSNPSYKDYQSVDSNGDCFVNIFPNCSVADK